MSAIVFILAAAVLAISLPFALVNLATPFIGESWMGWLEQRLPAPLDGLAIVGAPIFAALAGGYIAGVSGAWWGHGLAVALVLYAAGLFALTKTDLWYTSEQYTALVHAVIAIAAAAALALATWGASAWAGSA